mmetsp:Transcript_8103/g.24178  ORF Transcript_8103/g.24178 Transcript_8103/m.24178 type:complete len:296 (-) Transcript_8103:243-1130(-)
MYELVRTLVEMVLRAVRLEHRAAEIVHLGRGPLRVTDSGERPSRQWECAEGIGTGLDPELLPARLEVAEGSFPLLVGQDVVERRPRNDVGRDDVHLVENVNVCPPRFDRRLERPLHPFVEDFRYDVHHQFHVRGRERPGRRLTDVPPPMSVLGDHVRAVVGGIAEESIPRGPLDARGMLQYSTGDRAVRGDEESGTQSHSGNAEGRFARLAAQVQHVVRSVRSQEIGYEFLHRTGGGGGDGRRLVAAAPLGLVPPRGREFHDDDQSRRRRRRGRPGPARVQGHRRLQRFYSSERF